MDPKKVSKMNMRYGYYGIQFDLIKSGLQKAIRRGDFSAYRYAIEADCYKMIEKDRNGEKGKAKGNRTNLMNRLRIILVEDLFNWRAVLRCSKYFEEWEKYRKTDDFPGEDSRRLLSIIRELRSSKKIRLVSDLKVFYFRDSYREKLGEEYDYLFFQDEEDFESLLKNKNFNCLYLIHKNPEKTDEYWRLILKDDSLKENKNLKITILALKKLVNQLTKKHAEKYLYLISAVAFIILRDKIDWSDDEESIANLVSEECCRKTYEFHFEDPPRYSTGWLPENIVADKHTGRGRAKGAGDKLFIEEGSLVMNEDKIFYSDVLRKIYVLNKNSKNKKIGPLKNSKNVKSFKEVLDKLFDEGVSDNEVSEKDETESEKTKEITYKDLKTEYGFIYGQKVTASWKQKTYITKEWVYKGPYEGKRSEIPEIVVERSNKLLELEDSVLKSEIVFLGGKKFLRSKYIGAWPPHYKKDKLLPGDTEDSNIIIREETGIKQGYALIEDGSMNYKKLFYHFILRFIFGYGDSILQNYINNYGIDFEENRGKFPERLEEIGDIFTKRPPLKITKILDKKIVDLKGFLLKKLKLLGSSDLEKNEKKRLSLVLNLLS